MARIDTQDDVTDCLSQVRMTNIIRIDKKTAAAVATAANLFKLVRKIQSFVGNWRRMNGLIQPLDCGAYCQRKINCNLLQ